MVPSTDASKENTCEATFALMRCQCVSSNTNVIEDPKNGKELLGTRITHFELLHVLSLHDRHQVCVSGTVHGYREKTSWVCLHKHSTRKLHRTWFQKGKERACALRGSAGQWVGGRAKTGKLPKHWRCKQKLRRGTTSVCTSIAQENCTGLGHSFSAVPSSHTTGPTTGPQPQRNVN